ncbi:MAG TPA: hypothetical protein VLF69_04320 [Candidatus Saccharimonadales bacterium]|nr:hypothetical protein [Candidatus Saccharimonadales bacterium]
MHVTSLLLWVQENRLSEKFYKKIGFEVVRADDEHSVVALSPDFAIDLVSMRDEAQFAGDAQKTAKRRISLHPTASAHYWW